MKKKVLIICFILLLIGVIVYILYFNKKDAKEISIDKSYSASDTEETFDEEEDIDIVFDNKSAEILGEGASFNDGILTIKSGGTYHLKGNLNGYIYVKTNYDVRLIFDNLEINTDNYAGVFIENANKTIITVVADSKNYLKTNGEYKINSDDEPNGALFSKDDLIINGSGYLEVETDYEDGIVSKDSLVIINSNIKVTSKDDGIRGKDFVSIDNSVVNIDAGGDGIKSTNDTDASLGYVVIYSGEYNINAYNDGIDAQTNAVIEDGTFNIETTSTNSEDSAKGIKGVNSITIKSGVFNINSTDDSIHSNGSVVITGGTYNIASGDDAFHADESLKITDGEIKVTSSYEGLEAEVIEIAGGNINIVSSDDGINAAGGNDGSGYGGPRPGQNTYSSSNASIKITGGYIYLNASGDGFDSNGNAEMTGGTLIISGPTDNGNGTLDYDGKFIMTGGLLVAVGSAGMVQTPSSETLNTLNITLNNYMNANTIIHIEDESGNNILTYAPEKKYQSVVVCSESLKTGSTYSIYTGGEASGTNTNGLYDNPSYIAGTKYTDATINSLTTNIGMSMNGGFNRR